jgi:hypothetical protein
MKKFKFAGLLIIGTTLLAVGTLAAPEIKHQPVKAGVKGQPVYIRATVTNPIGTIKSATLHCAVSRDAAPFKVKMQDAGASSFIGTVPDSLLKNSDSVAYYIEAIDELDQTSETPWHTISMRPPAAGENQQPPAGGNSRESSWRTPLLIGGGVALAAGGALIAANISDDDNSAGATTPAITNAGAYAGSATKYFELSGSAPVSSSYLITITVLSDGSVTSDTLHPGTHLTANLSGSDFIMTAPVAETNLTGQINYNGTVLGGRITGTINGTAISSTGTNGTYSGIFSAVKQ